MPSSRRRSVWAPQMISSSLPSEDTTLEAEIEAIVKLLREQGPLGAATIRRELETRFWGPGRLRAALVEARRRGLVRRVGRRMYEAADR
jgi:winged helix DNA-binding protein